MKHTQNPTPPEEETPGKNSTPSAALLLALAGGLLTLSGILMAVCVNPGISGILWAAAACMFFSARHFTLSDKENEKHEKSEESDHE